MIGPDGAEKKGGKPEKYKTSDWQDASSDFQRTDELRVACEMEMMAITRSGGHERLIPFLYAIDAFFRQFKFVCTKVEREKVEKQYAKCKDMIFREVKRIRNLGVYSPMSNDNISEFVIGEMRDYLEAVYELRENHSLAHRVTTRSTSKERLENALGIGPDG